MKLLAQTVKYPFNQGFQGIGPLGNPNNAFSASIGDAATQFEKSISLAVGVMTVVGGIWFIFQIIGAAVGWVSAGGDKQAVQNAQKKLRDAITGLFIVVASYLIILFIGNLIGFGQILTPGYLIQFVLKP